ncbi:LysR family transcriptional regulator [Actinomycetospora lemnae]|uniref:LysR family transcriptional regulator n=1 Tax=Actinomycetospora lemnae TaxID=3019891 RepID=A0ABT5SPW0_9PSEU|nr:LysR family transcriptional regulator [Actinomycetospora sp. DW7H6]MDD7964186.1 LysR family transcriptional regulator [Actinomycetospora sp. DW7H6]
MRYDLLDLRLFRAVVAEGSITAGAARLHLSLPSASARVRALEHHAGVDLLVRGRRGVRPTPAGQALARHADAVLDELDRLEGAVAGYRRPAGTPLTLLAGSSPMRHLVPRALVSFLSAHPDVDVVARQRRSADTVRLLADGQADLGVVTIDARDAPPPATDHLADDSLVVVGPAGGAPADRPAMSFAEVAEHPLVGLEPDAPLARTLEANLGEHAPVGRYRGRAVDLDTVVDLAEAGVGLAVVPRRVVDPARGLAVCELAEPFARRTLVLRRGARPGPGVEDLAEHLRRAARDATDRAASAPA